MSEAFFVVPGELLKDIQLMIVYFINTNSFIYT